MDEDCIIKENHYRAFDTFKSTEEEHQNWINSPYTKSLYKLLEEYNNFTKNNKNFPELFIVVQSIKEEDYIARVHFCIFGKD